MKMCLLVPADIHGFLSGFENANKESNTLECIRGFKYFYFCCETQTSDFR